MHQIVSHDPPGVKQDSPAFTLHIAPALALLPPAWKQMIARVAWFDARNMPMRKFSRRISGNQLVPGLTWKTSDGEIRAYVRDMEAVSILHEAAHALAFATGFNPWSSVPLLHVFNDARLRNRSLDPTFSGARPWSYSLKDPDEFFAQLLALTLTEPEHDTAHPLLHPCAEKLWPGSTEHIHAIESEVHAAVTHVWPIPGIQPSAPDDDQMTQEKGDDGHPNE